jgi:hypothetical protein
MAAGGVLSSGLGAESVAPCGGGGGKAEPSTEQNLNIKLINERVFAVIQNNLVSLGKINHTAHSFFTSKSSVA